jgi:ubiquinone/menaquinone biosynthesis C-methylase UbiE
LGRLIAAVYDRVMAHAEEACLREWRDDLLRDLHGHVLEVGAGTGVNLPHYPRTLEHLVLSEPDPYMRRRLRRRARALGWDRAEVIDSTIEELPVRDGSVDAVVGTLVLCSVPHLDRALAEIRRVLRPGGRFHFLEHVAAQDRPRRLKWQQRVEPVWRRFSGGCHLTRRTADAIVAAGMTIAEMKRESMRSTWALVRPTIRGVAVNPTT